MKKLSIQETKGFTKNLFSGNRKIGQFVFGGSGSLQNGTYGAVKIWLEDPDRKPIKAKMVNLKHQDLLDVFKSEIELL